MQEKYKLEDLVVVGERANNTKRNFLLINKYLGKHLACKPSECLDMYDSLSDKLTHYLDSKTLVIGFAETATALGLRVAVRLHCEYIQTTRVEIPNAYRIEFTESHSHASQQFLYTSGLDFNSYRHIIIVDDEFTTGNTALKLVKKLKEAYKLNCSFTFAAIINGISDSDINKLKTDHNIQFVELVRTDTHNIVNTKLSRFADLNKSAGTYPVKMNTIKKEYITKYQDPRLGVDAVKYHNQCRELVRYIPNIDLDGKEILCIGTEECMYPIIVLGEYMEMLGANTRIQSTTRSPIVVYNNPEYPIRSCSIMPIIYKESFTEADPHLYLYNLHLSNPSLMFSVNDAESLALHIAKIA